VAGPYACRSLLYSAFCFRFTNPGRRELREREIEKEKKWHIGLGYLTLLPAVPSPSQ
jgi:hypothetical protein